MKTKTVFEMDYRELEELVAKTYGLTGWSFVADVECGNDSSHTFSVPKKAELDSYYVKRLEEFKAGGCVGFMTHTLMQDMVNNNVLQSGEYLVEVFW